jgi:hypothetical protein
VKWPFSAVEIEPVKPGVLDHPPGDHERADPRHPEIHGKTKAGAIRPAIAIKFTPGVLVHGFKRCVSKRRLYEKMLVREGRFYKTKPNSPFLSAS